MRFEISLSTYPDGKTRHIARDTGGVVRLREDTLEELHEAINEYNENLAKAADARAKAKAARKGKASSVKDKEETLAEEVEAVEEAVVEVESAAPEEVEATSIPQDVDSGPLRQSDSEASEPKREFLQNELKEQVEEKKRRTSKKTFWDKLK